MRSYGVSSARRPRRGKKPAIILLIVALAVLAFFLFGKNKDDTPPAGSAAVSTSEDRPSIDSVRGKYLFSGTIVLGRALERAAMTPDGGYDADYPFSGLGSLNFAQYDNGIIDMECPSTGQRVPYEVSISQLKFDCHPDYFPSMKKYFQITNLAGNHTYDAGLDGFKKTVSNIQAAGLQAVSGYDPSLSDDVCEVVDFNVRLLRPGGKSSKAHLPIALCSFHYQFHLTPQPGELEVIQRYSKVMPVIGLMHAGVEYTPQAIPLQQEIARKMIDYGAEFVVGNGAHWVQNTEAYKDKLIVYSTGNFIFDQVDYETQIGLSLAADMKINYDENLEQWIKLAEDCSAGERDDDCLNLANQRQLQKYQPDWQFDAVGSYGGYVGGSGRDGGAFQVTTKASAEQQADIKRRANWSQTMRELGQN